MGVYYRRGEERERRNCKLKDRLSIYKKRDKQLEMWRLKSTFATEKKRI